MAIRLHFWGATRNVTGSRFLLEVAASFGKYLFNKTGWQIEVPTYRQVVELE